MFGHVTRCSTIATLAIWFIYKNLLKRFRDSERRRSHLECIWGSRRQIGCGWAWDRSTATAVVRAVPGGPPPRRSPSRRHQHYSSAQGPTSTQHSLRRPLISTWGQFANGGATEARLLGGCAAHLKRAPLSLPNFRAPSYAYDRAAPPPSRVVSYLSSLL